MTALDQNNLAARERNLLSAGFPLERVIATGSEVGEFSPKALTVKQLGASAFVDDYAPYLKGVEDSTHKALILRDPDGSPNVGANLDLAHSTHGSLSDFVQWWLARQSGG